MENEKNPKYGQDSHNVEKQPETSDSQNPNLKENPDDYVNLETDEIDDPDAPLYPNQNRNSIDSNSASDVNEGDEEEDEKDEDFNEEVFEEDGDFEEKDIDYREKKERDSF